MLSVLLDRRSVVDNEILALLDAGFKIESLTKKPHLTKVRVVYEMKLREWKCLMLLIAFKSKMDNSKTQMAKVLPCVLSECKKYCF